MRSVVHVLPVLKAQPFIITLYISLLNTTAFTKVTKSCFIQYPNI